MRCNLFVVFAFLVPLVVGNTLEELFGAERVQSDSALRCFSSGFVSDNAKYVLDEILSKFKKHDVRETGTIYEDGKRFLLFGHDSIPVPSDVAFVYAHHMSLFDEDGTLAKMQAGLKAITADGAKQKTKKMLILVIEGPSSAADYAKAVLEESWTTLLDKGEDEESQEIIGQIVVHIVSVNGKVSDIAKDSVHQIVNDANVEGKPLISVASTVVGGKGEKPRELAPSLGIGALFGVKDDVGVDVCKESTKIALTWARDGANASLQRLQKQEAAGEFTTFVERMVKGAIVKFNEAVQKRAPKGVSATALKLAEQDIQRGIFTMLTPIYRRHVQLARQETAKVFNAAVGDDLVISASVLDDLNAARHHAMRTFTNALRKLTPKNAPVSTWSYVHDRQQLADSLDEFIDSRADQFRMQGVLPRGRKPVDFSIHVLANHPLGRDYRQDPLAAGDSPDVPFYDEERIKTGSPLTIRPSSARAILESDMGKEATQARRWKQPGLGRSLSKKDSEFAREMLMFPLSIKNPQVPIMAGRSSKKTHTAPPKKDPLRAERGPERFIRWDLPPLDEVKQNVEEILSSKATAKKVKPSVTDSVLNLFPHFSKGFYTHPPINYGPNYASSVQG